MEITRVSPEEFFSVALADAANQERVSVSVWVHGYLVNLLVRQSAGGYHPRDTLWDRFITALRAHARERARLLSEIGDAALVSCGLWWEFQYRPRRPSHSRYHLDVGRNAYARVGGVPYEELAVKFEHIVDMLIRFGTAHALTDARDILRLYRLWEETHSREAARLLADRGISVGMQHSSTPS